MLAAIIIAAFLIRIYYISYTPTWVRQHDVIGFGTGLGQAAFIEYFYEKLRLLDFDPRKIWGFFQPPLHHMLAGLWLRLMVMAGRAVGWSLDTCREKVQVLTLIYSMVTSVYGMRCLKRQGVTGGAFVAASALIALHPCLIQMSGSINNDMLCIMLQVMGMYYFLGWISAQHLRELLICGLCLGLSMMAKLSGIMLAFPMGVIMLVFLIRKARSKGLTDALASYMPGYLLFALISIPLGIWSPVRNYLKFSVPLMYTPKVGEPIEGVTLFQRFFYAGNRIKPFICMAANGDPYDEFNIPLAMLKTSLFGEADFSGVSRWSDTFGWILLFSGAFCALAAAAAMVYLALKKIMPLQTVFMTVYVLFSVAFLIRLSLVIPNFSSQDFRYIAHIIVPAAVMSGMAVQRCKAVIKTAFYALAAVFCSSSLLTYFLAGRVHWE